MATITTAQQKRQLTNHNVSLTGDETASEINTLWQDLMISNNYKDNRDRAYKLFRTQLRSGEFDDVRVTKTDKFILKP